MLTIVAHHSKNCNRRREQVAGACIHWTDGDYQSSVEWTCDPRSKVSYHAIIGPSGEVTQTVPWDGRAWAMGFCRPSDPKRLPYRDANNVFESIALAGGPPVPPTAAQIESVIALCVQRFTARGWHASETWRITTHQAEAIFGPGSGAKTGKRGRKIDPEGTNPAQKWLDCDMVRREVARRLGA